MKTTCRLIIFFSFLITTSIFHYAYGASKIKSIEFKKIDSSIYKIGVTFDGNIPKGEISSRKGMIQVAFENTIAWPKIEKIVSIESKGDANLMAYQYSKDVARVRLYGNDQLNIPSHKIHFKKENDKYWAEFSLKEIQSNKNVGEYDEKYLDHLLSDVKNPNDKKNNEKNSQVNNLDRVKTSQSSLSRQNEKFDIMKYVGKFSAFIALMLVVFYFVVSFFKKGALSKTKLRFLKNTNVIEVLNTNYLGPKRNLMLVKVQGQVFLIGNSEKGMHFLSEINDVTSIVKDQEKEVTGNNFDMTLESADEKNKEFKLKEVSTDLKRNKDIKTERKNNKKANKNLTDHIKSKIKDMKALQ